MNIPQLIESEMKGHIDGGLFRAYKKLKAILVEKYGLTIESTSFTNNLTNIEIYTTFEFEGEKSNISFELATQEEYYKWNPKGDKITIVDPIEVSDLFERIFIEKGFLQMFVSKGGGTEYKIINKYPTLTKEVKPYLVYYTSWESERNIAESVKKRLE